MADRLYGTVSSFHTYNGAGTIVMEDGREIMVRYSSIRGEGVRQLREGSAVSFQLQENRRGLYAVAVQEE
jgi:cold shock CspA family protein